MPDTEPEWMIEPIAGNVLTVRCEGMCDGWVGWVLLRSDAHHDSVSCRRDLERKHLELAKERAALIFDFGDTFDAMQGKFDPRRAMDDVRPEHKTTKYYDVIVQDAVRHYGPYANQWAMFAKGNHETAVLDKVNTDLISNLVYRLNTEHTKDDHRVYAGGYGGWVRFMFRYQKTKRTSIKMKYHHGSGGNAPVTRGVIQTNRQAVFLPDADIVVNGHNHQAYIVPIKRERITNGGRLFQDIQWHVRIPGYKDEWGDGSEGYAVEKNGGPTPQGSVWLRFECKDMRIEVKPIPEMQ